MRYGEFLVEVSRQKVDELREMMAVFVPFAQGIIGLEKVPRIVLKSHILTGDQPTMGRFHNEAYTLEVAIEDRHPVDVLRTLAHELCHAHQYNINHEVDGTTGSDDEDEAHVMSGVIMRYFNKKYPQFLLKKALTDGRKPRSSV